MSILLMPPLAQLIVSLSFMVGLAILLFAAPFVPPFRSIAVNTIFTLIVLGNCFIFFVISYTLYIYYKSGFEEVEDPDETEEVTPTLEGSQVQDQKQKPE